MARPEDFKLPSAEERRIFFGFVVAPWLLVWAGSAGASGARSFDLLAVVLAPGAAFGF